MHSFYRHLLVHSLLMTISVGLARQSPVIAAESRSPAKTEYQEGEVPAEPGLVAVQARQEPRPPMRELKTAVGDRFLIGVGIGHFVLNQAEDVSLIKKHFQILTPENCMKPQGIQPEEGKFRYENTDKFIRFAESNDLEVVGHCLVWAKDDRTSAWMMTEDGDPVTAEKLIERINTHIDKVVGRYGEAVSMWDVVNEALADSEQEYCAIRCTRVLPVKTSW